MSNWISNKKAQIEMGLSNGATAVLLSLLLLAGSDLAETPWEQACITWLSEQDQSIFGLGVVSFDLDQVAWQRADFDRQKAFLLRTVDLALMRHRWELLDYDPPAGPDFLREFRSVLESYDSEMIDSDKDWDWFQAPERFEKCPQHQVFQHANGCLICHDAA